MRQKLDRFSRLDRVAAIGHIIVLLTVLHLGLLEARGGQLENSKTTTWYVARTQPNGEAKADRNLRAQGYAVFWPRVLATGGRREIVRSYYSRYIFVGAAPHQSIYPARSTRGVSEIVGNVDRRGEWMPIPIASEIVAHLMARADECGQIEMVKIDRFRFHPGDRVRISNGLSPFYGLLAEVERVDGDDEARVWMAAMGGLIAVTIPVPDLTPLLDADLGSRGKSAASSKIQAIA